MSSQWVKEITRENFQAEVIESDRPVLLDFWAPWCGPCRMIAPHVEAVAERYAEKAFVGKVNVDENPELAQQFGVMSIPTLVVFAGGSLVTKEVGARDQAAIADMLAPHITE